MQKLQPSCGVNQHVIVRGQPWMVVDVDSYPRCAIVTLRGRGDDNFGAISRVLAPFECITPVTINRTPVVRDRRTVLRAAARAVARTQRWDECWTAATARIDLLAWQMQPAIAAVRGATRILLADSVGLGKTIEAALILTELKARRLVTRTLILTPASVRQQWVAELSDRFGVDAVIHDHDALGRLSTTLPPGVNPWNTADVIVSSIDLVKRPEVRAAVDAVAFDLLIVDEAHHVARGTDRGAVVAALASRVPWVVLATATPHSGDQRAFDYLQRLGALDQDEPLTIFRRSPESVGRARGRRTRLQPVHTTPAERALLEATVAYAQQMWTGRGQQDAQVRLVACVIARRAASSRRAILRTLRRRYDLLSGATRIDVLQPTLPWEEGEHADAQTPDHHLNCAGLENPQTEIQILNRLLSLTAPTSEAKMRVLRRLLKRIDEPALVFSEYRDTVEAYAEALAPIADVGVLHGGLTATARREAIHDFVSGRTRVLFATDAAGEGLNLHARCRLVINIELPWNPLRLEQRIGRVDRLGQQRRVHAIHLFHRGSVEDRVLATLERRMRTAGISSEEVTDEREIATVVFEGGDLCQVAQSKATFAIEDRSLTLLAEKRRLIASITRNECLAPLVDRPAVCGLVDASDRSHFVVLFEYDMRDGHERVVERHVIAVEVSVSTQVQSIRDISQLVKHIGAFLQAEGVLQQHIDDRLEELRLELKETSRVVQRRMAQILAHIDAGSRAHVFQGSLFDKRAERQAHARETALLACRDQIAHQRGAAQALETIRAGTPTLVAAWVER